MQASVTVQTYLETGGSADEIIFIPDKKAAHGDMSRLGGERHLDILRSTPQGRQIVLCHHVACQVFFYFFQKKVDQVKGHQDA